MLIKILYDNTVFKKGMLSDWGFAAVIEFNNRKILFDTGADGAILLHNMRLLDIDPKDIDTVFLSHHHFDHSGGLSAFLNINRNVTIFAPDSLRGIRRAREVISVSNARELEPNIYTTGELMNIEQAMVVRQDRGLAVIVGCSHPGVTNILEAASQFGKPYALIGGLHGFKDFSRLDSIEKVCPTHCTQYIGKIKELYPEKYIAGGAGRIIDV